MDRSVQMVQGMNPAVTALTIDAADLASLLHMLSDAAAKRGDDDVRRTLRLAARAAEVIVDGLEQLGTNTQ